MALTPYTRAYGNLPLTQITPFTYRDGLTFLQILNEFEKWLRELPAELEGIITEKFGDIDNLVNGLREEINAFRGEVDGIKDEWITKFDQLMSNIIDLIEELNDQAVASLVNNETSVTREALDYHYLKRNGDVFFPEDYWNAEMEPTNYGHTFNRVIDAAQGKPIILQSGKVYPTSTAIVLGSANAVDLRTSGAEPATIHHPGQSLSNIIHLQPGGGLDQDHGGAVAVETTMLESRGIDSNGWLVANPTGIQPGMICEVISSKLWYHDPRPGIGEARKSELHKVARVVGSRVYMDAPAQDGYNIASETVTLKFFNPISVHIDNITVSAVMPAYSESTGASVGIRIDHALAPKLKDVNVEYCARTGIYLAAAYGGIIDGGYSKASNNYFNGYGVSVGGSTHVRVTNRTITESRRGVDFSTVRSGVVSRNCVVDNSRCAGGGVDSRGTNYGWNPDGTAGSYQGGFGSHAGVDNITYRDNETYDLSAPFTIRGRNTYVLGNTHYGRADGGVVWASEGTNLYVENNRVLSNYWGMKDRDPYNQNDANPIDRYRADYLVTIYGSWQSNPAVGTTRGQLRIMNNHVETRSGLLRMALFHKGQTYINGNYVLIAHPTPGATRYMLDCTADQIPEVSPGFMRLWHFGNNVFVAPNDPSIIQTANFSLEGCNVLEYSELGNRYSLQAGVATALVEPPFTAGQIVRVIGEYPQVLKESGRVVLSTSVPASRVNVIESSNYRVVADITMSENWLYGVGAEYHVYGRKVETTI